jgi:Flp pilus assembly pilin Flp
MTTMPPLLRQLIRDDRGQDVIEYALLTATIGLAGVAVWPLIATALGLNYQGLDGHTQDLWEMPDPGGS